MVKARDLTRWTRTEISQAFKHSKKILSTPELDIRKAPALIPYSKILIIIPKKVGSAPQRNKIRRRLKALFYEKKLYTQSWNLLIFIKPLAITCDMTKLSMLLAQAYGDILSH